jgi:exopolysaccharide biosynthesis polyprenyl glycosylphosphotransferase
MHFDALRPTVFRLFLLWELLVFLVAFVGGFLALHDAGAIAISTYASPIYYAIFAGLAFLWHALLEAIGLYNSRRLVSRANEIVGALIAVTVAAGFLALLGALLGHPTNLTPFLLWFLVLGSLLMIGGRLAARILLRIARAYGRNLRFVTVVGAGPEGRRLARSLMDATASGYRLNGLFDAPGMLELVRGDLGPVRDLTGLSDHLMHDHVDEVLIALPLETHYDTVRAVMAQCRRVGVSARLIWPETDDSQTQPTAIEFIGTGVTSLYFPYVPSRGWLGDVKTLVDTTLIALALPLMVPLLLAVAVLIKLDSRGPVFFRQTRVGRNKQPFQLFKFRTMVENAESLQPELEEKNEAGGPVFKIRQDPRVTKVGQFLRRSSIDELPQLINVIRGEMSIVGPRPLPLRDVERFEHDWHARRFSVKPGLTCSWVLAGRSELEFDAWVQLDLDYIDNWSLQRDLMIFLRTIPVVLRRSGAF